MLSRLDLVRLANQSSKDLYQLGRDLHAAIETLPVWTSKGSRELLEQQVRRCLAIAASLNIETRNPDEGFMRLLLQAKKKVGAAVLVGLGGFANAAGDDVWQAAKATAAYVASYGDEVLDGVGDWAVAYEGDNHSESVDADALSEDEWLIERLSQIAVTPLDPAVGMAEMMEIDSMVVALERNILGIQAGPIDPRAGWIEFGHDLIARIEADLAAIYAEDEDPVLLDVRSKLSRYLDFTTSIYGRIGGA